MSDPFDRSRRVYRRHPAVWWSRIKWRWPLLFWLAAAGGAAFFYLRGGEVGGVMGYVEVVEHLVAPREDALIRSLAVEVGDTVRAGDLLARMDDSLVAAELAVEQAYWEEARGQVPEALQFMTQMERQFAAARNGAERDLQELEGRQSSEQAEREVVARELQRLEALHAERLIPASDLVEWRARLAVLDRQLADYPAQIGRYRAAVDEWRRLAEQARRDVAGTAGDRLEGDQRLRNFTAEAHANQIRLLELRRAALELRAPADGVVAAVDFHSGAMVLAGTPVLRIIETQATRVMGFLPEASTTLLRPGDQVQVYRAYTSRAVGTATLLAIEPAIRALPGRVSPISTRTVRGRTLHFRLEPGHALAPGETVELHVRRPVMEMLRQGVARFRKGGR